MPDEYTAEYLAETYDATQLAEWADAAKAQLATSIGIYVEALTALATVASEHAVEHRRKSDQHLRTTQAAELTDGVDYLRPRHFNLPTGDDCDSCVV